MSRAADALVEKLTGLSLLSTGWTLTLDAFPDDGADIELPRSPAPSVPSVSYIDADGDTTVMDADDWELPAGRAVLRPALGGSWPATRTQSDAVTISVTAGFGAAGTDVPEPLRMACRLLVAHWHRNREAVVIGSTPASLPMGVEALLSPYWDGRYG
jgi:uncharacterized phiE125 gp8 family phage protein